ncbi:MAG: hypothetical protein WC718_04230 [Phycisphaerales bacterium]|jgi:hypothetical protein
MSACPKHEPTCRAERRRLEREVEATRPAPRNGQGWRLNYRGRRYPVRESGPVDVDRLISESDAVAERLGCTCLANTQEAA